MVHRQIKGATGHGGLLLLLNGNDHARRDCVHAEALIAWGLEGRALLERVASNSSIFAHCRQLTRVMLLVSLLLPDGCDVQIVIVPAKLNSMRATSRIL